MTTPAAIREAIMNLPCNKEEYSNPEAQHAYQQGHFDARHAAAELVLSLLAQPAAAPTIEHGKMQEIVAMLEDYASIINARSTDHLSYSRYDADRRQAARARELAAAALERQAEENKLFRTALENVKKHQEQVGGTLGPMGTTWNIADVALRTAAALSPREEPTNAQ